MVVATAHEECPYCGTAIAKTKVAEVTARIRSEEQRRDAQAREQHETELEDAKEKLAQANIERAAFELKLKQAVEAATAAARKAADDDHAKKLADELARAREVLKLDFDKQILKQATDASKEKDELVKKLGEMQRKLDAKGVRDAGADIDVYEQLRATFVEKGDRVVPIQEGETGATIIHDVMYKGAVCARILVDAKLRKNLQPSYVKNLHDEMVESKADCALLATVVFSKELTELSEQNGVVLVHPARVVNMITILRRSLIKLFQARLSTDEREKKKAKLYKFVTSEACRKKLEEPGRLAGDLLEIDVEELTTHQRIWQKRGDIERKIQSVMTDVMDDIDAIVDGTDD